uniref:Glycine N-acyltransferase-like protein n=1 Tax=Anopheles atroparvus TaxID=41427 RepID=A0AAG5DGD4_ANOAO
MIVGELRPDGVDVCRSILSSTAGKFRKSYQTVLFKPPTTSHFTFDPEIMVTTCFLQRMHLDGLTELRDLYQVDWPKYAFTFYTLDTFVRWHKWFLNDEVQLYTDLRHDWRVSGTFVAKDHNELFFDTLMETTSGLKELLTTIVQICGSKLSVVCSSRFREMLIATTYDASYRKTSDDRMICYRQCVPPQIGDKSDLPYGYRCCPVRLADTDFVSKQWVHNEPMFANLPGRLIDRNPSLGVYDEKDQLVAWCLIDQTGSLALFQTVVLHQRKGLGRAIIDHFARQLHKEGILPQALIVECNQGSRSLFEKLGFEVVNQWCWIKFEQQRTQ